ncbi:hypothetical protein GN958_ATG21535 [Phytophthora infestans]|uniref:Uncharacterized protein n=1 Tax=Phytophthora infestans TaxID=4787 RepID=A0A8S9TLL7_PHYIN|nr:hypothetical protein GN958_ATG21535 [Phytophthora infestans]
MVLVILEDILMCPDFVMTRESDTRRFWMTNDSMEVSMGAIAGPSTHTTSKVVNKKKRLGHTCPEYIRLICDCELSKGIMIKREEQRHTDHCILGGDGWPFTVRKAVTFEVPLRGRSKSTPAELHGMSRTSTLMSRRHCCDSSTWLA